MHTNALIHEKSPYLRQHAGNPVDWLPWGDTAFEKAKREDKPIFLSVGYSTCHWCHVMAHESFEDPSVAEVLNRDFVPVKVDREERPDVDRIYMLFVQATSGSGGWPMSVWLTPELKPFFGGTYFPPDSRYGRPGFRDVLEHLARAWRHERERVESSSASVTEQLRAIAAPATAAGTPDRELFSSAYWQFRRSFDARWGGFGGAPKFPRPVVLNYLLRYSVKENNSEALQMVVQTLEGMARGGMHDHLGGGFHRYSVDERWFVPHFEKMLYDQAQLAISYLEGYQASRKEALAETARAIFRYVARDLTDSAGGFYSAEDADSPDPDNPSHSGEGAFYIWKQSEIESILGPQLSEVFCKRYGVEPQGNVDNDPHGEFTGRNILYKTEAEGTGSETNLAQASEKLLSARSRRPRPHLDDKVLTGWNGLMISAFAKGFTAVNDRQYLDIAQRGADFLLTRMYNAHSGQLLRRSSGGESAIPAFLDDYAFLAQALLDLFEATSSAWYLEVAVDLATRGFTRFQDSEAGGFFSTEPDAPDLLLRVKDDYDGAEPSGNSVATDVLLRLNHLTANSEFQRRAERALAAFVPKLRSQPSIAPQMLVALGRWLSEPEQAVIRCETVDSEISRILTGYREKFAPYTVVLAITDESAKQLQSVAPFLAGLERKSRATLYECRNFVCELPKLLL
jgi:uncharacterized protein